MDTAAFIGIDWGTTNLRGWLVDITGTPLDGRSSNDGMGGLAAVQFPDALDRLTSGWPDLPILACGMVGARQGWIEAPYVLSPASAAILARGLVMAPDRPDVLIVPGVAMHDSAGRLVDVMRGEETQAVGAASGDDELLICPGTHSKWIATRQGEVQNFQTFMTGELNALLGRQSVLRHSVGGEASPGPAFTAAVQDMLVGASLSAALFSVRVGGLDGRLSPEDAASRLSGLVIGSEVAAGVARFGIRPVSIIGDQELSAFYASALATAGYTEVRFFDGALAVCRGLSRIWSSGT